MPQKKSKATFEIPETGVPDLLDKDEMAKGVLNSLLKAAKTQTINIELKNGPHPFRVINKAKGRLVWGVGGCGIGG